MPEERPAAPSGAEDANDPRSRYRTLPEPVRIADTVESHDPLPAPDPTTGRDPERDFVLRNAG
ncbi:heme biosynthesis protein HemY [Kineococcus auxinigenes]|uniref:heme biosynthesis protein HemY n=1 Tax=unclassified Kineococcus TaxID=2621656 RepID=UPI003D7E656F